VEVIGVVKAKDFDLHAEMSMSFDGFPRSADHLEFG